MHSAEHDEAERPTFDVPSGLTCNEPCLHQGPLPRQLTSTGVFRYNLKHGDPAAITAATNQVRRLDALCCLLKVLDASCSQATQPCSHVRTMSQTLMLAVV